MVSEVSKMSFFRNDYKKMDDKEKAAYRKGYWHGTFVLLFIGLCSFLSDKIGPLIYAWLNR